MSEEEMLAEAMERLKKMPSEAIGDLFRNAFIACLSLELTKQVIGAVAQETVNAFDAKLVVDAVDEMLRGG